MDIALLAVHNGRYLSCNRPTHDDVTAAMINLPRAGLSLDALFRNMEHEQMSLLTPFGVSPECTWHEGITTAVSYRDDRYPRPRHMTTLLWAVDVVPRENQDLHAISYAELADVQWMPFDASRFFGQASSSCRSIKECLRARVMTRGSNGDNVSELSARILTQAEGEDAPEAMPGFKTTDTEYFQEDLWTQISEGSSRGVKAINEGDWVLQ